MKTLSVLLAVFAFFLAEAALANAVVTTATGNVQVQRGSSTARPLRQGDEVNQGDTVFTGANSSLVLKFDDGQIAALTANSRMTITSYNYNPQTQSGNILLSLIDGGMRALTGLIGRNSPDRVSYRAATATIGIRGTDVSIVTSEGNVVVSVTEGAISFSFAGRTVTVTAGQGVNARVDGQFQQGAAQQILQQIPPALAAAIGGLQGLTNAINQAAPGQPRSGARGPGSGPGSTSTPGGPTSGPTGGGAGGGGTASPS